MLNFLKRLFKVGDSKNNSCDEIAKDEETLLSNEDMYKLLDFSTFPDPKISNIKEEPVMLILDDIADSEILYNIDFKNMKKQYGINPYEEMKIVKCLGPDAGYIAYKYITTEGNKIDYAVLDITLGKHIKLPSGDVLEIDGVDIAIIILNNNPNAKIVFCSAHTLNENNPLMNKYITKFRNATNRKLADFHIYKNSNRVEPLYELIKGEYGDKK